MNQGLRHKLVRDLYVGDPHAPLCKEAQAVESPSAANAHTLRTVAL